MTWPSGSTADLGNTVKPDHMQDIPSVSLHDDPTSSVGKLSNMTYTIALTDPDAPSRANPKWSEMCHWIATNIPLSSSSTDPPGLGGASNAGDPGDVQAATQAAAKGPKEIMPYKPPGPPPRTGKHRYVFLAFAAANGTSEPLNPSKPDDRQHWGTGKKGQGVRQWARSNGLVPVGELHGCIGEGKSGAWLTRRQRRTSYIRRTTSSRRDCSEKAP